MSPGPTPSSSLQADESSVHSNETLAQPDTAKPLPVPPTTSSLIGTHFDDYEVLQEIGRGGMGVVFKAHQKSLDRHVALKMLLHDGLQDEVRLARFLTEARASASLNHPNIVQIYHVGQCAVGPYFAMEFIEGQSLDALLQQTRLTLSSVMALLIMIAEAVHYAHTRNIVHRDLKPANIMIDTTRRPVVMDFGIAKMLGTSKGLTQHGVVMGTPAFMAPEQAGEHLDKVGPHSDVYSLSAILYTLLTGKVPYDEGSPLRTVLKVIGPEMPPSVRRLRPDVPEVLEQICMKGLSKEPADRYPSAHALADHLRRVRSSLAVKRVDAPPAPRPGESSIIDHPVAVTGQTAGRTLILTATVTGKQVRLSNCKTIFGRASECDIVLKSNDVSKQHCQVLLKENEVLVEDLASANGTFVNGKPIKWATLNDGDRLTIARYEFEVRLR